MTNKQEKLQLLSDYYPSIAKHKYLATKAYGSRSTESAAHDASREYTRLLAEYAEKGGSLLKMAEALEVAYPSLRRRVMTAGIPPLERHKKSVATKEQYVEAIAYLADAKTHGTAVYHSAIFNLYNKGISLNRLAKEMGLKSAYPLYYGLNKMRMANKEVI